MIILCTTRTPAHWEIESFHTGRAVCLGLIGKAFFCTAAILTVADILVCRWISEEATFRSGLFSRTGQFWAALGPRMDRTTYFGGGLFPYII